MQYAVRIFRCFDFLFCFSSLNRRTLIFINLYFVLPKIIISSNSINDVDSVDDSDSENLNLVNAINLLFTLFALLHITFISLKNYQLTKNRIQCFHSSL